MQLSPLARYHRLDDNHRARYVVLEPEIPPCATLLIAPGRREFIEKKDAEMGAEFRTRGFRVIIFEWRGQGLSDRFLNGAKRQRDYIPDFNVHLHDLRSFHRAVVQPNITGPFIVSGHSMGGHLMLRWLAEDRPGVAAAILTAPMLALAPPLAHGIARSLCTVALRIGKDDDYTLAQHDYDDSDRAFLHNPLTRDPDRFAIIQNYFDAFPDMVVGGVTWRWLQAALHSMHIIQKPDYLRAVRTPLLALAGSHDYVTPARQLARHIAHVPQAEFISLEGARHDVMNEIDSCRMETWRHIDRFLGRLFPGKI
jgi:lysophospholipase